MRRKIFNTIAPEYEGQKTGKDDKYSIGAFVRDNILAVDFYENESGIWKAMWRTLIGEKEFCNYYFKNKLWSEEQLDTIASKSMSLNVYRSYAFKDMYRLMGKAGQIVKGFIKETGGVVYSDIWDTLRYKEAVIAREKRETAEERRFRKIQEKMALAPAIPDDFDSFIKEKLFKNDHIMYVSKEKAVCTRCGAETKKTKEMKHNAKGNCPSCGKAVTYKSIGRMSEHETKKEVLLIQRWENDVILRYFKCSLYSKNEKKESIEYSESIRTYHIERIEWYDKRYVHYTDFAGEEFWSDRMDSYHQVGYGRCCLYSGNLQEIVGLLGESARLPIEEMAEEGIVIPWKDVLSGRAEKNRIFEKLYKADLKKLAVEYIRTYDVSVDYKQKELKKILMITGPMFTYMRTHNSGKKVLEIFQDAKKDNHGLNDREIIELAEAGIKLSELKKVSEKNKIIKLFHYLKKTGGYSSLKTTYSHYVDYMDMMKTMDYDLGRDTVRYPRDLKAAHDKAVTELYQEETDKRKREVLRRYPQIRKMKKELDERYGYRDKEYAIMAPSDAADIVEEGRKLHHCVGGDNYIHNHNSGYKFILFLRRVQEPDKRYYTIEFDPEGSRIMQYYGYNDKKPDKEQVDKFLDKWKRQLKRKESRIEVPAAG